jgi:hypothetical protein
MHVMTVHVCTYLIKQLSAGAGVRQELSTSLEPDGSKGHVFEISIGVGTIYNFDIRGSAGILLVLDGKTIVHW